MRLDHLLSMENVDSGREAADPYSVDKPKKDDEREKVRFAVQF